MSGRHIFGRQLVGFFQQGDLIVERRAFRRGLPRHHRLQLLDALAQLLLFGVVGRRLVEIAERTVDVLISGSGRAYRLLGTRAAAPVGGCGLHPRFGVEQVEVLRCGFLVLLLVREQVGEVVHLRTPLLLFLLHPRLLVGRALVGDDARLCGQGHLGIEARPLCGFGLLLFGGREDQPHRACEKQSHKRVHEHLATLLPLLLRERRFRLPRFRGGRRILVLFHNRNTCKG